MYTKTQQWLDQEEQKHKEEPKKPAKVKVGPYYFQAAFDTITYGTVVYVEHEEGSGRATEVYNLPFYHTDQDALKEYANGYVAEMAELNA